MLVDPIEPGAVEPDEKGVLGILDCQRAVEQLGQDHPRPAWLICSRSSQNLTHSWIR